MADPSGEGWPSLLSETMSGLETNLNDDRAINEPMIGDFDGRSCYVFISASSAREISHFWLEISEAHSLFTRQLLLHALQSIRYWGQIT